jgi:glycerol-3-phosphate acyltransferase PlsX
MDYEETGGAFLLGVDGVVVIAHGSSGRRAIANALVLAYEGAERGLVSRIASKVTG